MMRRYVSGTVKLDAGAQSDVGNENARVALPGRPGTLPIPKYSIAASRLGKFCLACAFYCVCVCAGCTPVGTSDIFLRCGR